MAAVTKIDSNITGLRYCVESSIGVLPGSPIWTPLEPNSYNDFGGEVTLVARAPINPSRQRKKGVITDLDVTGGFNSDITQRNLQEILQGFFFASYREKNTAVPITAVNGSNVYSVSDTQGILVGSLVFCSGFTNAANNGLRVVSAVVTNTSFTTTNGATTVETPPATAKVVVVGFRAAAADFQINTSGPLPALISTSANFTTMGLIPGEFIHVGGDALANQFATAANNGFKRVKSISATSLVFDKSTQAMVADTGTGKSIDLYFGRVLKNETNSLIKRFSYQLERTLGAPDDALPNQIQAEYLVGCVPNELTLNIGTADKINCDLTFVGLNNEQRTGAAGLKAGTRPGIAEAEAFNTSSDFTRIKLALLSPTNPAPSPLLAYITEMTLTVNNNVTPNKAVAVLGAFDITAGTFAVSGSMKAYFSDVGAISAIRNNSNVTLDLIMVKSNAGMVVDIPLITLSDGRANIELDKPVILPLSVEASTGAFWDANMDHTLLMVFFDYLPSLADL